MGLKDEPIFNASRMKDESEISNNTHLFKPIQSVDENKEVAMSVKRLKKVNKPVQIQKMRVLLRFAVVSGRFTVTH
jgi:hypothetical protein